MKRFLPPPPLGTVLHVLAANCFVDSVDAMLWNSKTAFYFPAQTRLFASKDITANTRRKYRKLPEIVQKKVAEKEHKIRKNHRQLAGIFNKVNFK